MEMKGASEREGEGRRGCDEELRVAQGGCKKGH